MTAFPFNVLPDDKELASVNLFGSGLIGRVDFDTTGGNERFYYIKDHLGGIRLTFDQIGDVVSAQDYSPYGSTIRSISVGIPNEKYKFGEKEQDVETNYGYFGARFYNNHLGIWLSTDPMSDMYHGWSPYNYTLNSPVRYIDPNGMYAGEYYDRTGNKIDDDGIDDGKAYIRNDEGDKEHNGLSYYEVLGGESAAGGDYGEGFNQVHDNFQNDIDGYVHDTIKDLKATGKIKGLAVVTESVYPSPLSIVGLEGKGLLDMKYRIAGTSPVTEGSPITKTMYLVGNKYMNVNTAGNFLWGVIGKRLGFVELQFKALAQMGSLKQGRFDEPHEQKAISMGFNYKK